MIRLLENLVLVFLMLKSAGALRWVMLAERSLLRVYLYFHGTCLDISRGFGPSLGSCWLVTIPSRKGGLWTTSINNMS
jgi:hypothetical protein